MINVKKKQNKQQQRLKLSVLDRKYKLIHKIHSEKFNFHPKFDSNNSQSSLCESSQKGV